ncbi:MAG: sulfatase family protein, partial [Planctomycetota bacterium]
KRFKADGYTPDILTDLAIDFLRRKQNTPFMLSLHYWAPHASVKRRADRRHTWLPLSDTDWDRFKDKDLTIPNPDYPNLDIPQVTRMMREYLASVNSFDRNLGRVLDTLEKLNLSKNTIVIFTSDNGYNMGHNAVEGKGNGDWIVTYSYDERPNLYDNSLRVPTIIRWPGKIKSGSSIDKSITFLDWFPTLLAMAGINVPSEYKIHGRNFLPLLLSKSIEWDNDLFGQYSMRGAGIMRTYRTGKWKLVRDFKHFIKDQFYDLLNDPAENNNLIDSTNPDIQKQRELLDKKLVEKMKSIDDPALKIREGDKGRG